MHILAHPGDTDSVVWEGTQGSVGLTACVIFNQVNLGHTVLFPQLLRSLSRAWGFIARIFMITSQDRSCGMGLRQEDGVRWESKVALRMWFSEDPQQPAFVTLPPDSTTDRTHLPSLLWLLTSPVPASGFILSFSKKRESLIG